MTGSWDKLIGQAHVLQTNGAKRTGQLFCKAVQNRGLSSLFPRPARSFSDRPPLSPIKANVQTPAPCEKCVLVLVGHNVETFAILAYLDAAQKTHGGPAYYLRGTRGLGDISRAFALCGRTPHVA